MQNCPSCQMLMEDHETRCAACAQQGSGGAAPPPAPSGLGGPVGTAVLERPAVAPMPVAVRYRHQEERRRTGRWVVVALAVGAALVAVVVLGFRGDGPLADVLVDAGLVAAPPVEVPDRWRSLTSEAGEFVVSMPADADEVPAPSTAGDPAAPVTNGYEARLGQEGSVAVVSTDLGADPAAAAAIDDPAAFDGLVELVVAGMEGLTGSGRGTTRTDVPVGHGRAVDLVVVDDTAATTTRARVLLSSGRMYAVVTAGPDSGAAELDEVHARVLDSFDTTA